ncbi:DEAD/DEAH box helicase family protein [Pseudomonas sp. SWRI79]|uniref:DEAD/DEAH box helicase family protein n=1 Tax=Pseudomonas farris TaxID=2841207 RepID=A0ABS6PV53_9PSED|nr:helicase-related protein [Pseudomonas farris]MBV4464353.1 DEAD/DEAH box helicase family protein [Pseudomonas farris]
MPRRTSLSGSELFIVDNSEEDWKAIRYLRDWCQLSKSIDIATGYFEISALLALGDEWKKVDGIRILMGDEVSQRTKKAFNEGLVRVAGRLDHSIEVEKKKNDFLDGVEAIVEAIRSKKIQCRVYRKDKFHAKAYITHARMEVIGSSALVGSSNFTYLGLTQNVELNVQITGSPVAVLQEWYDQHWEQAEDVTEELLRVIERHVEEYRPFDIYTKALHEFFKGHELTATEWERNHSVIYKILAPYQREGYHALLKRANRFQGALLCDGVGLGKTYVGLMLIERLIVHDRLKVALFVPKSARKPVWERALKQRLPHLFGKYSQLEIFNHTDLMRGGQVAEDLASVKERADVILIDEAHHFRNTGTKGDPNDPQSRYWKLYELAEGKTVFMLTATPVNNRLRDLQHMIEIFSRQQADYFKDAPLGIHSLPGHFRKMEKDLERSLNRTTTGSEEVQTDQVEADVVLGTDALFQALVVQRSRAYVRRSLEASGDGDILFPKPREPMVQPYSVKQTYGKLLQMLEAAFSKEKPLFSLAIYDPYAYYRGDMDDIDVFAEGRQKQVVSLIRTQFLKRFESSVHAFRASCWTLLFKLLAWVQVHAETAHEKRLVDRWKNQHSGLIDYVQSHQFELFGEEDGVDADEDVVPQELMEAVEKLPREKFKVDEIISETLLDLDQIASFLKELDKFKPSQDKKLQALITLLKKDPVLKEHKVLIFSEFMSTARYLKQQLIDADIQGVEEIDSATKTDRGEVITRFSPYYNGSSSAELAENRQQEIRVLVATDVLSEGLNLQDATRIINYDLHWNPVRLMQRIGRVDRRMDPVIEARIVTDHPDQKKLRGETAYWNFLPPDELDELLRLFRTVSKKTLRISKTFGIEGRKLLTPEDDYQALKEFTDAYEGTLSPIEAMHLELQALLNEHPDLEARLQSLPGKVFSGKQHLKAGTQAVFFCYALPSKPANEDSADDQTQWTLEAGYTQWYLLDFTSGDILDDAAHIVDAIRSTQETPRRCDVAQTSLKQAREKIEKHIKNTYLKKVQAPLGVEPVLKAWMELN